MLSIFFFFFFFLMIRRPPRSTLFPSPPLFRSGRDRRPLARVRARRGAHDPRPRRAFPAGIGCAAARDRKSTRLNSSHLVISYAVFCLKKKKNNLKIGDRHTYC